MMFFVITLTLFYVILILTYFIVWIRIPYFVSKPIDTFYQYSILIPSRNEANTIAICLYDIIAQQYPTDHFEIIVINDDSTDETASIVEALIEKNPAISISLLNTATIGETGKKAAITYGVSNAKGSHILMTDADCTRSKNWLATINSFMVSTQSKMVYAPVVFKANTLFEKIQSLEFAGLVAIGGAAIELQNPNMCSASNLIIEKNVFIELGGYSGSEHIATGDDEFLLHKVCRTYPSEVHFLKNAEAIVSTSANNTLSELANQRKRWVSASTKYENSYITAILVAAYLFNALIVFELFASPVIGITMLVIKTIVEGLFLVNVLSFLKRPTYILLLPLAEPFHILYVLFIGLWGNSGSYQWKSRTLR